MGTCVGLRECLCHVRKCMCPSTSKLYAGINSIRAFRSRGEDVDYTAEKRRPFSRSTHIQLEVVLRSVFFFSRFFFYFVFFFWNKLWNNPFRFYRGAKFGVGGVVSPSLHGKWIWCRLTLNMDTAAFCLCRVHDHWEVCCISACPYVHTCVNVPQAPSRTVLTGYIRYTLHCQRRRASVQGENRDCLFLFRNVRLAVSFFGHHAETMSTRNPDVCFYFGRSLKFRIPQGLSYVQTWV